MLTLLVYDGNFYYGLIGTSASAPDFAGLARTEDPTRSTPARATSNYELYLDAALNRISVSFQGVFRENVTGYNGYYSTKPGYDRVLGTRNDSSGLKFLQAPPLNAGRREFRSRRAIRKRTIGSMSSLTAQPMWLRQSLCGGGPTVVAGPDWRESFG